MGRYHHLIGELKYHAGWFLLASVVFAPVVDQWTIFQKTLPSLFLDYFNFVSTYSSYFLGIGILLILWKWVKDWKILVVSSALIYFIISYIFKGGVL